MARRISWRPDPAVAAWIGLAAVIALLVAHGVTGRGPHRMVMDRGPFDPPVILHRLGPDS